MHDSQISDNTKPELQSLRILLWDIDGTMLRSTVPGGYKTYFAATMQKVFGSAGHFGELMPAGMTDTQIMLEALKDEGFTPDDIFSHKAELLEVFQTEMKKALAEESEPYEVLPGVREILAETSQNPQFINALLTGNLSVAGKIKLETVGLWHYFKNSPNAFGDISHNRNELAVAAGRLFNERYQFNFSPQQFTVIGDTPYDILCARHFGAKIISVETGRGVKRADLEEKNPDALIKDLSDTAKVLQLLKTVTTNQNIAIQ